MKLKHWLTIGALIILDLATKQWITLTYDYNVEYSLINGLVYILNIHNTGAAWSILEGGMPFFVVSGAVVSAAILYILYKKVYITDSVSRWGLVIILAGTWGNLYDRIALGYVRDFMGVFIGSYAFPIFNVADSCITIGVALIIIRVLFEKEVKHDKAVESKS